MLIVELIGGPDDGQLIELEKHQVESRWIGTYHRGKCYWYGREKDETFLFSNIVNINPGYPEGSISAFVDIDESS